MCKDATEDLSIAQKRMEALSDSRKKSLEQFATSTGSKLAIVFLYEKQDGIDFLLSGYCLGSERLRQKLRGKKYQIEAVDTNEPYQSSFANFVTTIRNDLGLDKETRLQPLFQLPVTGQRSIEFIGVVVYDAPEKNSKFVRAAATILSSEFSLSRSQRVVETTIAAQDVLQRIDKPLEKPLEASAEVVSNAVFCKEVYIKYADQSDFLNLRTNQRQKAALSNPEIVKEDYASRCTLQCEATNRAVPAIVVPVDKPHFQLKKSPFSPISNFLNSLNRKLYSTEAIIFTEKIGDHYLQNEFSATDLNICNRIFYNLQGFIASNEFQSHFIDVTKELKRVDESTTYDASNTQEFVVGLDSSIAKLACVRISRSNINFSLEPEGEEIVEPSYLSRISEKYLNKIFSDNGGEIDEGVFVGVDIQNDRTILEIHLSSHMKDGMLYFCELRSNWISDATLRALLHYFSELHVRLRREKFLEERESFMSQVRHVVVHHISTARKSLSTIQRGWNAAGRDKELWDELRKDTTFRSFIDLALSNLSVANRKLELGRFIIDEISPSSLNRKQIDIIALIEEILQSFKFNREEKRLIFRAVLKGSPPKILNADRELLSIALINLVDNAVKYSSVDKEVEWGVEYKDDRYRFHITSRGMPIQIDGGKDEVLRTRLRAKQLDHLNQRHGTGWGLPVAAKILEAHHSEAILDFVTEEDFVERSNSQNTFFFEMPYKTGQSNIEVETEEK